MTVNLHVQQKIHPAPYHPKLEVIATVPQFAVSRRNDVCSFVCRNTLK
jgi:hypothetical protein